MKIGLVVFSGILAVLLSVQAYRLYDQRYELVVRSGEIQSKMDVLRKENDQVSGNLEYLANFDNLAKELKALFNYKKPGEKLFIIVPKKNNQ